MVLGFSHESRRGGEEISGKGFVVVLVAEVISGDSYVVVRTRGILAGYRLIAERRRRGAILLGTSQLRKSPGGTGGAWLMGTGRVRQGRALFSEVGPISKEQEDEVEWVRAQLSETERECGNLVTQKNLLESGLLQGMAGIIRGSTKVAVDIDEAEMQKRLRESRAKKAEKGAGKRPRDDDEGRVADVLGKRKALEEAHQHVMGSGPRLPPFDLQAPPKLPFGMEDVFAEGVEKVDFGRLRQQKKEVNLAMHRQEVPLVNVFLEGVKSDPEALARTPASSFIDRAQKTILTSAYAFGEMYVSMAKADKEIQRLKRRDEMAKSKMAEAQEAREKNALLLQKALAKEVEELKRSKAEEVAAARVEAIESFRTSEELKSYIMDRLVDEQLRWEDRLVRFNPSVEINFDTSGEPPAQSPPADASVRQRRSRPLRMPLLPSLEGVAFFMYSS
ncbi:hypothetical protein Prudu_017987 [Prunus dulcis]|uniref:Uncharacterized protein n=1 Tax=Prunus dulcis TaxID=3755 RepID=A0A4Y1RPS7_PRUDU|nr:hypothetical protein Prudu_017987 [Prunus dulcis]